MSRERERAASEATNAPDKQTLLRALDLCAHMQAEEHVFVLALRSSAPAPSPKAVGQWVRLGWVVKDGKWLRLTAAGQKSWFPPAGPDAPENWFLLLGTMPARGTLQRLVRDGVIENANGYPRLTSLGKVVQNQIRKARAYIVAHPELYDGERSGDLDKV